MGWASRLTLGADSRRITSQTCVLYASIEGPTRWSSERGPADSLRDKFNVIGCWPPSLTFAFGGTPRITRLRQMPKELSDAEFRGVTVLSGPERYSHFVRQVADFQEVWSLRTPDGWVSMGDDAGARSIPVWPHRRYAEVFVTGDWSDAEAAPIELQAWMERWLPGMAGDGVQVAVFPVVAQKERGVVVPPEQLQRDLEQELEQYE